MDATAPGLRSACDLLELYRRRELSPVEVAEDCLARIGRWNAAVGAFCVVDHEGALAAARASEARWARGEPCGAARRRAGDDQGHRPDARLPDPAREPDDGRCRA